MPKTATRQKEETKTNKSSTNGANKTASKTNAKTNRQPTDTIDPKLASAEHKDRRQAQKFSIKNIKPELLKEMLYQMVLGRIFEQKCAEVYRIGKIGGFCHLYIGQEAVGIGTIMALRQDDYVITAYRDHVQAMVKGITPEAVMAELYGRAGGNV
ncbi:MAG: thiamine pyrophosphate-dependent enzyme, partial [Pyrinomonadaceae bacterium]